MEVLDMGLFALFAFTVVVFGLYLGNYVYNRHSAHKFTIFIHRMPNIFFQVNQGG